MSDFDFDNSFLGKAVNKIKQTVEEPSDTGDLLKALIDLRHEIHQLRIETQTLPVEGFEPFVTTHAALLSGNVVDGRAGYRIRLDSISIKAHNKSSLDLSLSGDMAGTNNTFYFPCHPKENYYYEFLRPILFDPNESVYMTTAKQSSNEGLYTLTIVCSGVYIKNV